jgi:hypothetical protein
MDAKYWIVLAARCFKPLSSPVGAALQCFQLLKEANLLNLCSKMVSASFVVAAAAVHFAAVKPTTQNLNRYPHH